MRQIELILALTLAFQTIGFASPASDVHGTQESAQVNKVRTDIQKYDTAKKKQLKVTLRGGDELKGYVSRSDDMSFDLNEKSGHVSKLTYADVDKVQGAGLGRGAKIAIVVGCAVAVTVVVFAVGLKGYY
jgi:hypothetical protein